MLPFSTAITCQMLLLLGLLTMPANATQVWIGTGRITKGSGQGGAVELRLETKSDVIKEGDLVKSLHGPPLHGRIKAGTIQNTVGFWRFKRCSQNLCVILTRTKPAQTIVYRLHRRDRGRVE